MAFHSHPFIGRSILPRRDRTRDDPNVFNMRYIFYIVTHSIEGWKIIYILFKQQHYINQ